MRKEKSVFEFCRDSRRMNTRDLFTWMGLDINENYGCLDLGDCYLRVIGDGNVVEFSEPKGSFDRWANSGELTLDLAKRSDRRQFINIMEAKFIA